MTPLEKLKLEKVIEFSNEEDEFNFECSFDFQNISCVDCWNSNVIE